MLNRIRVRGKLFLLLAAPLLAVLLFAYIGIINRLDTSSGQTGEESLALFADSGSDLRQAVSHERLLAMMIGAGSDQDISGAAESTHDTILRWLDSSQKAVSYIESATTIDDIDALTVKLRERVSNADTGNRSTTSTVAELSILSRSIEGINDGLVDEATDLNLFKALSLQGFAGEMHNAATEIAVVGATSIRSGEISDVAIGQLNNADARLAEASSEFQAKADDTYVSMLADLRNESLLPRVSNGGNSALTDLEPLLAAADPASTISWLQLGLDRIDGIHGLSEHLLGDASLAAGNSASAAQQSANRFMVLAMSVALVALLMAILIGRSISRPLVRLSRSATQLSKEELPALVESMRTGGRTAPPRIEPLELKGRDEVADLANAISEIQRVTLDVAEEQTDLLHRGISAMFVNLARRNQSLLDHQIDFIDGMEAHEEDPDQLENLFRLDHLATRMRRNADSLLVLAGSEPSRRRGEPVTIESVTRVAVSEIEDYQRVDLCSMEDCLIASSAAVDLAHMASELMENATQFSPPDSHIDVVGRRTPDGAYQITVADHGIGMGADKIIRSNELLAKPPAMGLDMGRSLGFTVVARIASRLGATVRLAPTPGGGLTAVVSLPGTLVVAQSDDAEQPDEPIPAARATAAPARESDAVEAAEPEAQRSLTSVGLVRRTPGSSAATMAPASRDDRAIANERSPDQVRETLSRYRGGLQRGRQHGDVDDTSKTD